MRGGGGGVATLYHIYIYIEMPGKLSESCCRPCSTAKRPFSTRAMSLQNPCLFDRYWPWPCRQDLGLSSPSPKTPSKVLKAPRVRLVPANRAIRAASRLGDCICDYRWHLQAPLRVIKVLLARTRLLLRITQIPTTKFIVSTRIHSRAALFQDGLSTPGPFKPASNMHRRWPTAKRTSEGLPL